MVKLVLIDLRDRIPLRTAVATRKNYRHYKGNLRKDFNARCGYCDAMDKWFGGFKGAHIDHFAPKSKFEELTNCYTNLVYSCPSCNNAKWDKWVGDDAGKPNDGREGFVDPCDTEYDSHLARRKSGEIVSTSELGEYMVENLNLQLARHKLIWQAQMLEKLSNRLEELRSNLPNNSRLDRELLDLAFEVFHLYKICTQRIADE